MIEILIYLIFGIGIAILFADKANAIGERLGAWLAQKYLATRLGQWHMDWAVGRLVHKLYKKHNGNWEAIHREISNDQ